MKKIKIFTLLVLLIGSVLLLSGCRRTENGNGTPTNEQITLIWWNVFESQDNVQPLIDAFQEQHSNVVIQYKQQGIEGGVSAYRNLLDNALTDTETINDPDIYTIENTWVGKYEQYITPAPSDIVSTSDLGDFYPIVQSDFAANSVLGLPMYVDTLAVIYNKDKLIGDGYSTPGNEWSEFQQQALNLTKRDGGGDIVSAGLAAASGENVQFNFDILSLLMLQNGVDLNSSTVLSGFSTNPEVQDSFDFYSMFSGRSGSWDEKQKLDVAAFLEGRLAMFIAPSWRLNDILIYNDQYNLGLDIGVAPLPQLSGTDTMHWGTYWGQTVAKGSPNPRMAWEFVKFISQPEQLKLLDQTVKNNGRQVGIFYPRLSMASEISSDPNLRVYVQAIPFAKSWFMYDGYEMEASFNKFFTEGARDLKSLESTINNLITR